MIPNLNVFSFLQGVELTSALCFRYTLMLVYSNGIIQESRLYCCELPYMSACLLHYFVTLRYYKLFTDSSAGQLAHYCRLQ